MQLIDKIFLCPIFLAFACMMINHSAFAMFDFNSQQLFTPHDSYTSDQDSPPCSPPASFRSPSPDYPSVETFSNQSSSSTDPSPKASEKPKRRIKRNREDDQAKEANRGYFSTAIGYAMYPARLAGKELSGGIVGGAAEGRKQAINQANSKAKKRVDQVNDRLRKRVSHVDGKLEKRIDQAALHADSLIRGAVNNAVNNASAELQVTGEELIRQVEATASTIISNAGREIKILTEEVKELKGTLTHTKKEFKDTLAGGTNILTTGAICSATGIFSSLIAYNATKKLMDNPFEWKTAGFAFGGLLGAYASIRACSYQINQCLAKTEQPDSSVQKHQRISPDNAQTLLNMRQGCLSANDWIRMGQMRDVNIGRGSPLMQKPSALRQPTTRQLKLACKS